MAEGIARIEQLIPAYNLTRFPTVLTPAQQQRVVDTANITTCWSYSNLENTVNFCDSSTLPRWKNNDLEGVVHPGSTPSHSAPSRRASTQNDDSKDQHDGSKDCTSSTGTGEVPHCDGSTATKLGGNLRRLFSPFKRTGASNTWVLSGNKTASGKPLLANDPHLDFTAPSAWMVLHIRSSESSHSVIGSSFPGAPGVS